MLHCIGVKKQQIRMDPKISDTFQSKQVKPAFKTKWNGYCSGCVSLYQVMFWLVFAIPLYNARVKMIFFWLVTILVHATMGLEICANTGGIFLGGWAGGCIMRDWQKVWKKMYFYILYIVCIIRYNGWMGSLIVRNSDVLLFGRRQNGKTVFNLHITGMGEVYWDMESNRTCWVILSRSCTFMHWIYSHLLKMFGFFSGHIVYYFWMFFFFKWMNVLSVIFWS